MDYTQLLKEEIKRLGFDISYFEEILDIPDGELSKNQWQEQYVDKVYRELHELFGFCY